MRDAIKNRGPDLHRVHESEFTFESSLLSLRPPFTPQPIVRENKVFCFNGQIYGIDGNDTEFAFSHLDKLMETDGEFAFVFYDGQSLYFGRDWIGRRSLLYSIEENGLNVCSVGSPNMVECEAGVLYKFNKNQGLEKRSFKPTLTVNRGQGGPSIDEFVSILRDSVSRRMVCPADLNTVAVLFSGGLDCTILARLMDQVLDKDVSIDLLNVAFENKRTSKLFETPDRILARRSFDELQKLTTRKLKLVEIDIPYEEALKLYPKIKDLMYPKTTVMDLSIALAFYCAASGRGSEYESRTPILISGLGADELFGGYSRHMGSASHGPERLSSELELDFNRLGSRNLGRDDRVCADWGKEVRYPFLDQRVVELALAVDINMKATSTDTKIFLRKVAELLDLSEVCREKKRAIQFGARSAKMDPGSGRVKGTDQAI